MAGELTMNVRYSLRALSNTPGFFLVVVLTLALGIGANTAIFSVLNSLLLRTLPVSEPGRLALLTTPDRRGIEFTSAWPYRLWEEIERRSGLFDGVIAWSNRRQLSLAHGGGEIEQLESLFVSGEFFSTLGVSPLIGRTIRSADDVRGAGPDGPVAVISHGFWQRRFGGTANALGTSLVLDGTPFTVVGVTPPEFFGLEVGRTFDVAVPIASEPLVSGNDSLVDGGGYWLRIMVRLKSDQTPDAASAVLQAAQAELASAVFQEPVPKMARDDFLKRPLILAAAPNGVSRVRSQYQRPLLLVLAIVGLVLVIACANVANLLLARAFAGRHELRIRMALGESRWGVARQQLAESTLLAGCGAGVGILFALWGSRALIAQISTPAERITLDVPLDWRVLAFTAAVSCATAIVFGTAPAYLSTRLAAVDALRRRPHRDTPGDIRSAVLPRGLVVAQVALSVIIVIAAGLLLQTFTSLASQDPGFDRDRVLVVNVSGPRTDLEPAGRLALYEQARDAVRVVPGVAAAAISMLTPVGGVAFGPPVTVSRGPTQVNQSGQVFTNMISPEWFTTMGIPLAAGRDFTERDRRGGPPTVIVNQAFARTLLNGANPLGHTVTISADLFPSAQPMEIIGLVGDSVYVSPWNAAPPTMYVPLAQFDAVWGSLPEVNLHVRASSGPPIALARNISAAVGRVNPDLTLRVRPLAEQLEASLLQERLMALLSTTFGGLAVLLAALGLYGITAYGVTRRRHEIGIRMALGARRGQVLALVLGRSGATTALGIALGVAGAAAVTRYLEGMLFGLTPLDPATFVAVSLVFAAVAAVASYVPARAATRVDPVVALRCE